jgi:ATP-dependent helicase HrpB
VFLPGRREIRRAQAAISATRWGQEIECTPLHGDLPLAAQARAIAPPRHGAGKVVLATSIAESSLTIEAVELVIDSGLSRRNRFDPASGMDRLQTLPASLASAEQRRGRAGRQGPGQCLRLWTAASHQRRSRFDPAGIEEADPLPIALQLAAWGSPHGDDLPWLTPPPRSGLEQARNLLRQLGALDPSGTITPHGRSMAGLGIHPRLAHMLLRAEAAQLLPLGCSLAVLLSERDPLPLQEVGCDLMRRLEWLEAGGGPAEPRRRLLRLRERLRLQVRSCRDGTSPATDPGMAWAASSGSLQHQAALLLGWAYPERLARRRGGAGAFLLRGGRGARLPACDPLAHEPLLAVARLDGEGAEARVLLAARLPQEVLDQLAAGKATWSEQILWDPEAERVRAERRLRLGALVLRREPCADPDPEGVRTAMAEGLRRMGIDALPWTPASRRLQQRLALAHALLGPPWPDRSPAALACDPVGWLGEHLAGRRSRRDLQDIDLVEALWGDLGWPRRHELASLLPEQIRLPSGRRVPIDYSGEVPVLAVKLQEMFGLEEAPRLLGGQLPLSLHLQSPAGRPVAITRDLAGFWKEAYAGVRKELRGRYPRHPWPEDPLRAEPTSLTKAALRRRAAVEGR